MPAMRAASVVSAARAVAGRRPRSTHSRTRASIALRSLSPSVVNAKRTPTESSKRGLSADQYQVIRSVSGTSRAEIGSRMSGASANVSGNINVGFIAAIAGRRRNSVPVPLYVIERSNSRAIASHRAMSCSSCASAMIGVRASRSVRRAWSEMLNSGGVGIVPREAAV